MLARNDLYDTDTSTTRGDNDTQRQGHDQVGDSKVPRLRRYTSSARRVFYTSCCNTCDHCTWISFLILALIRFSS